jgi:hypothetical protein
MSKTLWAIEGPDDTVLEVNGRKFASNDTGAPMLVSIMRTAEVDQLTCRSARCCVEA